MYHQAGVKQAPRAVSQHKRLQSNGTVRYRSLFF
jgi:hypothetical protein